MTIILTDKEGALVAELLELASDQFSNHGCNDFDLPKSWSREEIAELLRSIHRWNGDEDEMEADGEFDPKRKHIRTTYDWLLMTYFAAKLRGDS